MTRLLRFATDLGEDVMRISVGGIFSKCPQCGCEEFARQPGEKAASKVLECCACRQSVGYDELAQQNDAALGPFNPTTIPIG
jgi:hypothetical protein